MNGVETRVVRRETHSPRSTSAIVVATVLGLLIVLLATEGILQLLGMRPLVAAPRGTLLAVLTFPDAPAALRVGVAVVAAVIGLILLGLAVFPGRRARRALTANRVAVVADDGMLASALARAAARTARVDPDAVRVSLGRRSAAVQIVPVSGDRVDRAAVRRAVEEEFAAAGAEKAVRVSVTVAQAGRVGS